MEDYEKLLPAFQPRQPLALPDSGEANSFNTGYFTLYCCMRELAHFVAYPPALGPVLSCVRRYFQYICMKDVLVMDFLTAVPLPCILT